MIDENRLSSIRSQTGLTLPDDDTYLYHLGVALYGFSWVNSFMTEIICHIDDQQDRTKLLDLESGKVLVKFSETLNRIRTANRFPEIYSDMEQVVELFERLNSERTDFVHAYPITNEKKGLILQRRKDSKRKYFEVTNDFLDSFTSQFNDVVSLLYKIRKVVKPSL